jgi:hypothetical protein
MRHSRKEEGAKTLNLLEKYEQRTLVAVLVLIYTSMRIVSALRSFHFRRCLERLEAEARRLATPIFLLAVC